MAHAALGLDGAIPLLRWLDAYRTGIRSRAEALSFADAHADGRGTALLSAMEKDELVTSDGFNVARLVRITEKGRSALARQVSPRHELVLASHGDRLVLSLAGTGAEPLTASRSRDQVRSAGGHDAAETATTMLFGTRQQPRWLLASVLDKLDEREWARIEIQPGIPEGYLWELARAYDHQRLAARADRWVSFVRCQGACTRFAAILPEPRLAIAVGSGPGERERLEHAARLGYYLRSRVGWKHADVLDPGFETVDDLATALRASAPTILYLLSHGTPGILETGMEAVSGAALTAALSGLPGCELVILGVCHAGEADGESSESTAGSLAVPLVQAGIPWVVAPLGRADLSAFNSFASAFLKYLWRHGGVERAVWRGRREMHGGDPAYPALLALFAGPGRPAP